MMIYVHLNLLKEFYFHFNYTVHILVEIYHYNFNFITIYISQRTEIFKEKESFVFYCDTK